MGPFPPGVAWLIRPFHCFTIPLWAACSVPPRWRLLYVCLCKGKCSERAQKWP